MHRGNTAEHEALRRQARLLVLLHGAGRAGLAPMGIIPLHAYAYLANVLAPVWALPALDGRVLKRRGGPYYPALQRDLDRLVGMGLALVSTVQHVPDRDGRWRLDGRYRLNECMSSPALAYYQGSTAGRNFVYFAVELAYALSALGEEDLESALVEDATYSDPSISENNVLDFAEWVCRNPSAAAAEYFNQLMPEGSEATPGEKLHLYVRHLHRRMHV